MMAMVKVREINSENRAVLQIIHAEYILCETIVPINNTEIKQQLNHMKVL